MAYSPIAYTVPQYHVGGEPASGYVLKAYQDGTSTLLQMATDSAGGTLVNSVELNAQGYPVVSGNVIIPHVDQAYKLALYPSQAAADANSSAVWSIDNLAPALSIADLFIYEEADAIASSATVNLDNTEGDLVHITGTTGITAMTLAQGVEKVLVFDGALTITHSSSLICPGAANITTEAGDCAIVRGEGSGVTRFIGFFPAALSVAELKVLNGLTPDTTEINLACENSVTGNYTGTLTGVSGTVQATIEYRRVGPIVTLSWPTQVGTSNSTGFTVTGAPASITPATQTRNIMTRLSDNSAVGHGTVVVQTDGTLLFGNGVEGNTSGFTAANNKGLQACTITYHIV